MVAGFIALGMPFRRILDPVTQLPLNMQIRIHILKIRFQSYSDVVLFAFLLQLYCQFFYLLRHIDIFFTIFFYRVS